MAGIFKKEDMKGEVMEIKAEEEKDMVIEEKKAEEMEIEPEKEDEKKEEQQRESSIAEEDKPEPDTSEAKDLLNAPEEHKETVSGEIEKKPDEQSICAAPEKDTEPPIEKEEEKAEYKAENTQIEIPNN